MKIHFCNPTNGRFYFMAINEDLFGDHEILISRGSNNRKPIIKCLHFKNYIDAMYEYFRIAKLRIKHGYNQVT